MINKSMIVVTFIVVFFFYLATPFLVEASKEFLVIKVSSL